MSTNAGERDGGEVSVRVTLPSAQAELLEDLSANGGPFETRSEAAQYVISEYQALACQEPLVDD